MFRLGLVGAGRMGLTHLRALAGNERVRVVAVAEPSEQARQTLDGPGLATYPDVDAMLRSGGLDGVLIAAPSTLHVRIVAELTAARLPILCEKPCGLTAREAQQAMAIASAANIPLQIAYWRRFVPTLQHLRRRIVEGELGELYFLACSQWDGAPPAAQFRAASGGIFVDMGVHEFDQIRWLSGQEFATYHAGYVRRRRGSAGGRRRGKCPGSLRAVRRQQCAGLAWPPLSSGRRLSRRGLWHDGCRR